jgi:ribosome-binding factor A
MSKRTHRSGARPGRARQSTHVFGGNDGEQTGHRHERLERILLNEIEALIRESADPGLERVRIVALRLSPDGASARVGYAVEAELAGGQHAARSAAVAVARATPFLRARLADLLDLKHMPRLSFTFIGVRQPGHGSTVGEEEP